MTITGNVAQAPLATHTHAVPRYRLSDGPGVLPLPTSTALSCRAAWRLLHGRVERTGEGARVEDVNVKLITNAVRDALAGVSTELATLSHLDVGDRTR